MTNRPSESELLSKGFWLLLSQYGSMAVSILFTFWLARLLGPAEFGRFAIGVFSFDIFNALTDWGWEQGVFLAPESEKNSAYATHFFVRGVQGVLPLLGILGVILVAPGFIPYELRLVGCVLALSFCLEKVSLTYKTILERSFALKRVAFFEFLGLLGSFLCALGAVKLGCGFIALPLQRLFEKAFILFGYVVASPWRFSSSMDFGLLRRWISSFGFATWSAGLVSLALYDFVGAFVGLSSGVVNGGLYARSFKMATLPLMVTTAFNRITTSLYAHASGDLETVKGIFLRAQFSKMLLIFPAQVFLAVTAPWWIVRVLGEQWAGAVVLYQLLTIYGGVRSFYDDVSAVFLYGMQYPWIHIQQHVVQVCCMIASWMFLKNYYAGAILGALVMSGGMVGVALWIWRRVFVDLAVSVHDVMSAVRDILLRIATIVGAVCAFFVVSKSLDETKKNSFNWRAVFRF